MTAPSSPIDEESASNAVSSAPADVGQTPKWTPPWLHIVGYILALLLGSSGEFLLGVWDRAFPENQPPSAKIEVTPTDGQVPLTVTASASASSDPDGDPLTYKWSVDGSPISHEDSIYRHTFHITGDHAISVEVYDKEDLVDTAGQTVTTRETFSPILYIDVANNIERWINAGDHSTALALADQWRYTCGDRSVPDKQCARLHALAAEAQLTLDRVEEGFKSIATASEMMPNDVFHTVTLSHFHLLRNAPNQVIIDLGRLSNSGSIGAHGSLNLGIAYAIMGEFAYAATELGTVLRGRNKLGPAARLAQLLTATLQGPSDDAFRQNELRPIVCEDDSLRGVFENTMNVEHYVLSLRVLVQHLRDQERNLLQSAMEVTRCA